MRYGKCLFNRRTRQRLHLAAGVLSLSLWLFMAVAENYTPLHAWLHGGTIPDDDDCAIVAIAHGKVETVTADVPVVVPTTAIETTPCVELSVFTRPVENLLSGRAPPSLSVAS
jgi:hypothetical protein